MKHSKFIYIILFIIIILSYSFIGCNTQLITPDGEDYTNYTARTYQTTEYFSSLVQVVVYSDFSKQAEKEKAEKMWKEICNEFASIDSKINITNEESDISKFNKASKGSIVEIEKTTYELLKISQEMNVYTNGYFDPSAYNSVDLWGFSARFFNGESASQPYDRINSRNQLPSQKYIDAFARLIDYSSIKFIEDNDKYFIEKSQKVEIVDGIEYAQKIDIGGIGKGYAVDMAQKIVEQYKFNFGYINVGTSSWSFSYNARPNKKCPNELDYVIGIKHPRATSNSYIEIYSHNIGLSTSGDYERYYTIDDIDYCHIIDSTTGKPIQTGIMSATALGENSAKSDAVTTAIMAMGIEKAKEFISKNNEYKIVMCYQENNKNYVFSNFPMGEYKIKDNSFIIGA